MSWHDDMTCHYFTKKTTWQAMQPLKLVIYCHVVSKYLLSMTKNIHLAWQKISEISDHYLLWCLHFTICSLCIHWASSRELNFWAMGFGLFEHLGAMTKISEVSDQYLLCCLHFSICSLCIYWAPYRELQEEAPFLENGILAPHIFRSNHEKFQKPTSNICFVS